MSRDLLAAAALALAALAAAPLGSGAQGAAQWLGAAATATPLGAPDAPPAPLDGPAVEAQLADLINALRIDRGLPPLDYDPVLADLARQRCLDMVERRYFSHDIPGEGYAPLWLLRQVPGARGAGENLGLSDEPNGAVVQALFAAWVASPAHYENLVRPQFNRVGIGVVEVPRPRGPSLKVVAQVFAVASGPLREQPAIFLPQG